MKSSLRNIMQSSLRSMMGGARGTIAQTRMPHRHTASLHDVASFAQYLQMCGTTARKDIKSPRDPPSSSKGMCVNC